MNGIRNLAGRRDKMARATQRDRVLQYIHDFGYITSWDAYKDLGVSQLGARIFELKKLGYIFETERIKTVNRYGVPSHYDKYMLVGNTNDIIDRAKENAV